MVKSAELNAAGNALNGSDSITFIDYGQIMSLKTDRKLKHMLEFYLNPSGAGAGDTINIFEETAQFKFGRSKLRSTLAQLYYFSMSDDEIEYKAAIDGIDSGLEFKHLTSKAADEELKTQADRGEEKMDFVTLYQRRDAKKAEERAKHLERNGNDSYFYFSEESEMKKIWQKFTKQDVDTIMKPEATI